VTNFIKKLDHCPQKWYEEGTASLQWVKCLMKRHPHLALRRSDNTSLAWATNCNHQNVQHFQYNYKELLLKFQFTAKQIYNLDEMMWQLGHVARADTHQMTPVCTTINTRGNVVPPVLVFPHVRISDALLINAPEKSLCLSHDQQEAV
jgi:hypothetical protein